MKMEDLEACFDRNWKEAGRIPVTLNIWESREMPAASQLAEQDVDPDQGCSKVATGKKVRGWGDGIAEWKKGSIWNPDPWLHYIS